MGAANVVFHTGPACLALTTLVIAFSFATPSLVRAQASRDIEAKPPTALLETQLYGDSWAVVIGIDRYQHAPRLTYAVNDARSIAASLPRFGFTNIISVENEKATAREIRRLLGDELPRRVKKTDRVVIFFAGHGATRELAPGREMGYLVPVDGDLGSLHATSISMREISDFAELIDARHVLFLLDACYGGLALRDTTVVPKYPGYLTELIRKPVRQVITAGGRDERVVEEGGHGLFTKFLLRALEGEADDGDGIISAMQLGSYLQKRVAEASSRFGAGHTPLYGRLAGDGDFVFVRPGTKISALLAEARPPRLASPPVAPTSPGTQPQSSLDEERRRLEEERRRFEAEKALLEERKKLEAERRALEERHRLAEERRRLEQSTAAPALPRVASRPPHQQQRDPTSAIAVLQEYGSNPEDAKMWPSDFWAGKGFSSITAVDANGFTVAGCFADGDTKKLEALRIEFSNIKAARVQQPLLGFDSVSIDLLRPLAAKYSRWYEIRISGCNLRPRDKKYLAPVAEALELLRSAE